MAYISISQLDALNKDTLGNEDYLLISSGTRSHKINVQELKVFMTEQFVLEDWVIENKVIDSITNTIHATAVQYKVKAAENLLRGDVVTLCASAEEALLSEPVVRKCVQANYPIMPAVGIMQQDLATGQEGAMITIGIFKNIDTSAWPRGTILYTGTHGEFTTTKPPVGFVQQQSAFVLNTHETDGDLMVMFGPPLEQAQDISYNNSLSGGLISQTVSTALDEIFTKCDDELITTSRILIANNEAIVPRAIHGNSVNNAALIYDNTSTNVLTEYTCIPGLSYDKFTFDPVDNLNGKYAKFTYLAIKIK